MTTNEPDLSNVVVPLRFSDEPDPGVKLVVNNTGPLCIHRLVEVEESARRVTCRDCGAPLDPFDALLKIADNGKRLAGWLAWHRQQIKAALGRIEVLKRLEQNARQRVKRTGVVVPMKHQLDEIARAIGVDGEESES